MTGACHVETNRAAFEYVHSTIMNPSMEQAHRNRDTLLHYPLNAIPVIKWRRMVLVGHVARVDQKSNSYRILVANE